MLVGKLGGHVEELALPDRRSQGGEHGAAMLEGNVDVVSSATRRTNASSFIRVALPPLRFLPRSSGA